MKPCRDCGHAGQRWLYWDSELHAYTKCEQCGHESPKTTRTFPRAPACVFADGVHPLVGVMWQGSVLEGFGHEVDMLWMQANAYFPESM